MKEKMDLQELRTSKQELWLFVVVVANLLLSLAGFQANITWSFSALALNPVLSSVSARTRCSPVLIRGPQRRIQFLLPLHLLDKMSLVFRPVFSEVIDLHLVRFFPFLLTSLAVTSGVGCAFRF